MEETEVRRRRAKKWLNTLKHSHKMHKFNPFEYFINDFKEMNPIAAEKMMEKKQCFNNAVTLLMTQEKVQYVEGFLFFFDIPIRHAWNIINGQIIDFTHEPTKNDFYFGTIIPPEMVFEAINHKRWVSCCGVLDTLRWRD